jgi:hypothetical protein
VDKQKLHQHLVDAHGRVYPNKASGWTREEMDYTHRLAHGSAWAAEPHEHDGDGGTAA